MSTYLVTGGAGFIGSHLTDRLIAAGHHVIVIDDFSVGTYIHPQAQTIHGSLLTIKALQSIFTEIDGCFHLVAIPSVVVTMNTWFRYHKINLQSSLNVFKSAINAGGVPVVYASSCAVYGEASELPLHEELAVKPISAYACDKLAVEKNAYFLSKNYQLPTLGLRFFNVYGPRQNPRSPYAGVICNFISRLLHNESPIVYGDGSQTRDFIYVNDIVKGLMHAMKIINSQGEVVNLCTGIATSISQLAQEIAEVMGKNLANHYQEKRLADVQDSLGSTIKMKDLGFSANYDLALGLSETVEFMGLAKQ